MIVADNTASKTATDLEALNKAVEEAETELIAANEVAGPLAASAVSAGQFDKLSAIGQPVTVATNKLQRVKDALAAAIKGSRWNDSITLREPIMDALRETFIDNRITAALISVTGSIRLEDGKAVINLVPRFDNPKLESLAEGIAAMVDVDALAKLEIGTLEIRVTDLDKENAMVSIDPSGGKGKVASGPKAPKAEGETATRGSKEYIYNGQVYTAREFLTQLETENAPFVEKRAQSFNTVLHTEGGNGMSNLARDAAKFMDSQVTVRERVK